MRGKRYVLVFLFECGKHSKGALSVLLVSVSFGETTYRFLSLHLDEIVLACHQLKHLMYGC
jgi:hypothetical protein